MTRRQELEHLAESIEQHVLEWDSDPPDDEEDDQITCVICGCAARDNCCICDAPLCHMHFELGGRICNDPSEVHEKLVEEYYDAEEREWAGDET